jgi:hypothetical protein
MELTLGIGFPKKLSFPGGWISVSSPKGKFGDILKIDITMRGVY